MQENSKRWGGRAPWAPCEWNITHYARGLKRQDKRPDKAAGIRAAANMRISSKAQNDRSQTRKEGA